MSQKITEVLPGGLTFTRLNPDSYTLSDGGSLIFLLSRADIARMDGIAYPEVSAKEFYEKHPELCRCEPISATETSKHFSNQL